MNEQLQTVLAELLSKTTKGIDAASTFLVADLPDVVYQLLLWYGVKSAVCCILAIVFAFTYIKLEIKLYPKIKDAIKASDDPDFCFSFLYLFLGSIPRVMLLVVFWDYMTLEWLQIWIAPKIWLLEYSASLVK